MVLALVARQALSRIASYFPRIYKGLSNRPVETAGGLFLLDQFLDDTDEQLEKVRKDAVDQANEQLLKMDDILKRIDQLEENQQNDLDALQEEFRERFESIENILRENFERQNQSRNTNDEGSSDGGSSGSGGGSGGSDSSDGSGSGSSDGGSSSNGGSWLPDWLFPYLDLNFTSPIVLDLNGNDTIDYVDLDDSTAYFDLSNDGFAVHTAWITGGDGFLARDNNGDGIINNQSELFGINDGVGAYEKLATLNSNGDTVIDTNDAEFDSLLIWVDGNEDGFSQPWELQTLEEADITALGLEVNQVAEGSQQLGDGAVVETSYFIKEDGTTKQTVDILFRNNPVNSLYIGDVELNEEVFNIPYERGYGTLPDLPIAASLDSSLLQTVQEFVTLDPSNIFGINLKLDRLLYQWAGSLSDNAQNTLRLLDERKIGVLESIAVQDANLEDGLFLVGSFDEINTLYDGAKFELGKGLLIEGIYQDQFVGFDYNPFSGEVFADASQLGKAITALEAVEPATPSEQALFWKLLYPTLEAAQANATLTDFEARIDTAITGSGLTLEELNNPQYGVIFSESIFDDIQGSAGNDLIILTGETNDVFPNQGNDYVYWGNGDGDTVLFDFGSAGDNDTVHVELSLDQADLTPEGQQDLLITNIQTNETLEIRDFFNVADGENQRSVENVVFTDAAYTNGELIDVLNTTDENDNVLTGSNGDDTFTLRGGDDIARGYLGDDRYDVYADGNHTINDAGGANASFTDIVVLYGVNPSEVSVSTTSNDAILSFGADTSLTLESQFLDNGIGKIEEVRFDSDPSTIWTTEDLQDLL